jgi:hypothetical protein
MLSSAWAKFWYSLSHTLLFFQAAMKPFEDWSALEDDFRTFLLMPGGSESIFQKSTANLGSLRSQ